MMSKRIEKTLSSKTKTATRPETNAADVQWAPEDYAVERPEKPEPTDFWQPDLS